MVRKIKIGLFFFFLGFGIQILLFNRTFAAECENWIAKAVSVQGTVTVLKVGEKQQQTVELNDTFCAGDVIQTGANSRGGFVMSNDSTLRINQNSEFTLKAPETGETSILDLLRGAAHFFSRTPKGLEVRTPYTVAGVRGTEFLVTVLAGKTLLTVYEGAVRAENAAGGLTLESGDSAVADAGKSPVLRVVANPRDAVR